jgi:hypothetical protein
LKSSFFCCLCCLFFSSVAFSCLLLRYLVSCDFFFILFCLCLPQLAFSSCLQVRRAKNCACLGSKHLAKGFPPSKSDGAFGLNSGRGRQGPAAVIAPALDVLVLIQKGDSKGALPTPPRILFGTPRRVPVRELHKQRGTRASR